MIGVVWGGGVYDMTSQFGASLRSGRAVDDGGVV